MSTIPGSTGPDTLDGTSEADFIDGLAGNDSIQGFEGDDTINGGAGNDTMRGGEGNDLFVLDQAFQAEVIDGGADIDTIELRLNPLQVVSAIGTVSIHTLNTSPQLVGVERLVFASQAGEAISGQILATQVTNAGMTEIVGGAGLDLLTLIYTPGAANPAVTFTGFDVAPADAWGAFQDRVTLVAATPMTINAYTGISAFQVLAGSSGNDTLNGSDNADILNGAGGVNVLNGGGGNDMLVLINQATPNGSGGFNLPTFLTGQGSLFNGGSGTDLLGIGGYVFFQGTLQDIEGFSLLPAFTPPVPNTPLQEAAHLVINASLLDAMTAPLIRGTGIFEIDASDPVTFEGRSFDASSLVVEAGSDVLIVIDGEFGDGITLTGSNFNDSISMGDGAQVGFGGNGDDIIDIGSGNQTVTGGAGADRFLFDDISSGESGESHAIITDFTIGEDKIDLNDTGLIFVRRAFDFITQGPDGAVIAADNNGYFFSVTLQGVDLADLSEDDFLVDQPFDPLAPQFDVRGDLADVLTGGLGNDSFIAGGGDDTIYTGGGRDTIDGGAGNDRIIADGAIPAFSGGPSPVTFNGGADYDVLELRSYAGALQSPFSNSQSSYTFLFGVSGIEEFEFASLAGEAISATLIARSVGTPPGGTPQVSNLPLPLHLRGGDGIDTLIAVASGGMGPSAEIVVPDFIFHDWSPAAKTYLTGDYLLYVLADGPVLANYVLRASTANAMQGAVQFLLGSGGNDTMIGSEGREVINGNAGANLLQGLGGDDALVIGNGTSGTGVTSANTGAGSVFDGGEGNDFLSVGGAVNFQGTLENIEGIYLQPEFALNNGAFGNQARAQLTIAASELAKLGPNARFDGVGDIFVTFGLNDNLDTSGFVFEAGSDVNIVLDGEVVIGSSGNDSLVGAGGPDTFFTGGGRDTVVAAGGDDTVIFNGQVFGGSNFNGGAGTDTLVVRNFNDQIVNSSLFPSGIPTSANNGLAGSTLASFERLVFDTNANTSVTFNMFYTQLGGGLTTGAEIVGGNGLDTLLIIGAFNAAGFPAGYTFNAPVLTYDNWQEVDRAYQAGDRVLFINTGNANGVINGSAHAGAQFLIGGAGNETINGSNDMDFLSGGLGVNQVFGNGGDDVVFFGNTYSITNANGVISTTPETTYDAAGSHFDGGAGRDFLMVAGNANFQGTLANFEGIYLSPAYTNPAPATVQGQTAMSSQQYYTTLTIDNSLFQLFPREVEIDGVGTIHVEIDAGTRFDGSRIVFTEGSDVRFLLEGSSGNDFIEGTANDDTIEGGDGLDFLTGGAGNDVFAPSLGRKIVTDFTQGEDRVDLSEVGISSITQALGFFSTQGTDAVFTFHYAGQNNLIRLQNTNVADLTASDFIFASPSTPRMPDATELSDVLIGQSGADTLVGLGGNDTIYSGGGVDSIDGGEGNDTVILNGVVLAGATVAGGDGTDTLVLSETTAFNVPNIGLVVPFTNANLSGFETLRFNTAEGSTVRAVFSPAQASSITSLVGGAGTDIFVVSTPTGGGTFSLGAIAQSGWTVGTDAIVLGNATATGAYNLSAANHAGVYVLIGGAGNDTLTGSDGREFLLGNGGDDSLAGGVGNDTLDGGAGNDTLDGGAGADSMTGAAGDDLYVIDSNGDVVTEAAGGGSDTITSSTYAVINASLFGEIEVITYTGTGNAQLTGSEGANTITGSSGNDLVVGGGGDDSLNGATGVDTMTGGAGNDTYFVDGVGDAVNEVAGEGIDTVLTTLAVFNLNDRQAVENVTSTFAGGALLTGNPLDNVIVGGSGNDTLDGLVGADTLNGGEGDDLYTVDNALDVIIDSGGIDTVRAKLEWTLAEGLERLEMLAAGTGTGNSGDNTITGTAGLDSIAGAGGNDLLIGGAGGDTLDGGTGADTMQGGLGSDTYIVDDAGDLVDETGGNGTDIVNASAADYTLTDGVERLVYTGAGNFAGTGNALANIITGGNGDDTLDGGAGRDTLNGGAGNDVYVVDISTDVIQDSGGIDSVQSTANSFTLTGTLDNLEFVGSGDFVGAGNSTANDIAGGSGNDSLSGNAGNDTIFGNDGNDTLLGGAGNDQLSGGEGNNVIIGGLGKDAMSGGSGVDTFRFLTLTDTRIGVNADVISSFQAGTDKIDVSAIDPNAGLLGDQSYAFIGNSVFSAVAGQAEVRFLTVGGNTMVNFDNDGNGTTDMSIQLSGIVALTSLDFIL